MSKIIGQDSCVYFGEVQKALPDWRHNAEILTEKDPDDKLLAETPEDVIAMLSFDPLEE